jgi:Flp pilus assembly protein TadD
LHGPADPVVTLGRESGIVGERAEAAADLAKARELAPDDVDVLFTSFEIAIAQGRFADAEQMVLEARRLFPADERVYRGMASLAARQGDLERANTVLREALTTKLNDHSRVSQLLVDVLIQQGRPQEAEAALAAHAEKYGDDSPEIGKEQIGPARRDDPRRRSPDIARA